MLKKLKNSNRGFTIIEVLIVLAIAGLIMLIVFLAVPALQRNQRNAGYRTDSGRIGSAAANFVTNNNGTLPSSTGNLDTILSDVGNLSQGTITSAAAPAADRIAIVAGTAAGVGPYTVRGYELITAAKCGAGSTAGTQATSTNASARQMALLYPQELGNGTYSSVCVDI